MTGGRLSDAHADRARGAALVAIADRLLQPRRSFPTPLDLTDTVCPGPGPRRVETRR